MARIRSRVSSSKAFNVVLAAVLAISLLVPALAAAGDVNSYISTGDSANAYFHTYDPDTGIHTWIDIWGAEVTEDSRYTSSAPDRSKYTRGDVYFYQWREHPEVGEWSQREGWAATSPVEFSITNRLTSARLVMTADVTWWWWADSEIVLTSEPVSIDFTWSAAGPIESYREHMSDRGGLGSSGYRDWRRHEDGAPAFSGYVFNDWWWGTNRMATAEGSCVIGEHDFADSPTDMWATMHSGGWRSVHVWPGK